MIKYFIAPYVSYKLFSLSLLIKIGNWFVGHVLGNTWTACMLYLVFRRLWLFFFQRTRPSNSTAESEGRQCCACPLDLCYTKMRHSHRRLHPDTFVAHPCSQAVGQCIFSLTLMGHRMSPLTSGHVQHWQQLDEQSSCIFHWWWSGEG